MNKGKLVIGLLLGLVIILGAIPNKSEAGKPYKNFWIQVQDEYGTMRTDFVSITVYDLNTTTPATIYSSATGGSKANPILLATTSNGTATWYGDASTYDIIVTFSNQVVSFEDFSVYTHRVMCLDKALVTSMTFASTTDASSLTAAAIVVTGGAAIAKQLYLGDDLDLSVSGTGVYDITLKDAVADALSIVRGTTDMVIFNTTSPSITFSGSPLVLNAATVAALTISGTCSNGINATGTFTDHVLDIQPAASMGDYKAIYIGTWGTEAEFNDGGGLFRIYGKVGSGGTASANIFVRTLTDSTSPPIGAQFYTDSDATTPGPKGMSAVDAFAVLNAGKYLAAAVSTGLDSMHAVWAKVTADVTSVCNGTVFPLWVDNQMNCAVAQEEYGIFATTGGTRPDGFIGFETSSSGYDQFIYADTTFNSGAGTCITTDSVPGTQDARIKVWYDGTQYYIPLYR